MAAPVQAAAPASTLDRLAPIIASHLGCAAGHVTPTADLAGDLGADSLDMYEIVMAAEEEFGCDEIGDDDIGRIRTVGDAVALIDQWTGRAA